jgi:hypothetical protein
MRRASSTARLPETVGKTVRSPPGTPFSTTEPGAGFPSRGTISPPPSRAISKPTGTPSRVSSSPSSATTKAITARASSTISWAIHRTPSPPARSATVRHSSATSSTATPSTSAPRRGPTRTPRISLSKKTKPTAHRSSTSERTTACCTPSTPPPAEEDASSLRLSRTGSSPTSPT